MIGSGRGVSGGGEGVKGIGDGRIFNDLGVAVATEK